VIDEHGNQLGILSPAEAMRMADERGFDLIEIAPNATPPVCRLLDYGKYRYEQMKREKLQRKNQQTTQVKEIRLHPNTDVHDFEYKARHTRRFLEEGNKVKATVIFKGREITYQEHGKEILDRLLEKVEDVSKVEQEAKMEGRSMVMILTPDKSGKKAAQKKKSQPEI
jgi:translation initiation factor IF-3